MALFGCNGANSAVSAVTAGIGSTNGDNLVVIGHACGGREVDTLSASSGIKQGIRSVQAGGTVYLIL